MEEKIDQEKAVEKTPQKGGYYKKSWKKWLIIYLIAAVIIYGGIYIVLAYTGDDSSSPYSY